MNKKLVPRNIERNAILTKQQKIHLKSEKVDPKILNNIRRTLEKKLDGLTEDLDIIKNSKSLENWRLLQSEKFQELHKVLESTVMNFKPFYPFAVKTFSKKVGTKKFRMFWMDISEESNFSTERIFEPSFALRKIKHYFNRLSNDLEPTYNNIGKTKFNMLVHRINNYFEISKRKKFLDNNASRNIEEGKFLYFPLQSEPEATLLAFAPFYSNQISLIETVAKAIPIDSLLYVKEHPTQKDKFWRSIKDYKKIIDIPNVKLLHPKVNSLELVERSQGVIAISGSTGFEALFYKKPVIIFGDEHYEKLSMVTKIKEIGNLSQEIKNALMNYKFNQNELNIFMKIFNELSLQVRYASIMKDGVSLSAIQRNGENFDLTNMHFKKYTIKYGSKIISTNQRTWIAR